MSIPDRVYKLAKNYLETARSRWDDIDSSALRELDEHVASPALSAFERAQAKIRATQSANQAAQELKPSLGEQGDVLPKTASAQVPATAVSAAVPVMVNPASPSAMQGAYKILGVAEGAGFPAVQTAYQELRQRADPARFVAGSAEQKMAEDIQRRVNAAYILLANSLSPATDDRFDRLEL
jgi:hypothetical protein